MDLSEGTKGKRGGTPQIPIKNPGGHQMTPPFLSQFSKEEIIVDDEYEYPYSITGRGARGKKAGGNWAGNKGP